LVVALIDTVALVLVARVSVWAGGAVVMTWKAKESEVGVALSDGVFVIVTFTGITVLCPPPLIVTVPVNDVPVVGRLPGLTVTEIEPVGGFPVNNPLLGFDTVIHWPPSVVDAATVKLVTEELLLIMVTFWDDGTVLPGANV
jgi:hypothetical protein